MQPTTFLPPGWRSQRVEGHPDVADPTKREPNRLQHEWPGILRHQLWEGRQHLDLDAARRELLGDPVLASMKWEQEGVPAPVPLMRQDLGAGPEETLSGEEKQRVRYCRPPGRRSLVRLRRRHEAKSRVASDRAARSRDGVVAHAANQSSPTAKAAYVV
jgi:hypothetical protein